MSAPAERLAERLIFVLVQPQHPGNVGAVARAMMNMGLSRLVVVDPPPSFDLERARWMAPGAHQVLADMRIVATLDEAFEGVHRAIASTARHRRFGQAVLEPAELATQFYDDDAVTAVLFGREDTGLSANHVQRCESITRIPTDEHASLNLAQASLLLAHAFFEEGRRRGMTPSGRLIVDREGKSRGTREMGGRSPRASVAEVEPAVMDLVHLLARVGFLKGTSPEKVATTLREGMQRAAMTQNQTHAVRGMVKRFSFALDHPEIDWTATTRQKKALAKLERKD